MEPQFPFLENGDDSSYFKNTSKDIHAVHLCSPWHVASVPVSALGILQARKPRARKCK